MDQATARPFVLFAFAATALVVSCIALWDAAQARREVRLTPASAIDMRNEIRTLRASVGIMRGEIATLSASVAVMKVEASQRERDHRKPRDW